MIMYPKPNIVAVHHALKEDKLKLLCDGYHIFLKDVDREEMINLGKLDEAKKEWEKLKI